MKSDRELLELAAKAAGIAFHSSNNAGLYIGHSENDFWRPLTDDGDALRLAVTMGSKFPCFTIGIFNRASFPHVSASIVHRNGDETYIEQDDECDLAETARRAIVRAAAAIGEEM